MGLGERDANKVYKNVEQPSQQSVFRLFKNITPFTWQVGDRPEGVQDWDHLLHTKAPNLTLNIDGAIPKPKKVLLFTCLGLSI
jgi:hypothetical protein